MALTQVIPGRKLSKRSLTQASHSKRIKMTIYLTPEAKRNLEQLQFKLLDNQGRKPTASQIVEGLLKRALKGEKIPTYPVKRKSLQQR